MNTILRPTRRLLNPPRSSPVLKSSQNSLLSTQRRALHVSSRLCARERAQKAADDPFDMMEDEDDVDDDRHTNAAGWEVIRQQKQFYDVMRRIEIDAPLLAQYRKPFTPPPSTHNLLIRKLAYSQPHPANSKRVLCVAVSSLPLVSPTALHNFKILAGTSWLPTADLLKDSGFSKEEIGKGDEHGYIKISCEMFYNEPEKNFKWTVDVLNRLIDEANARTGSNSFEDIPQDLRHLRSKAEGKLDCGTGQAKKRATIADFPKEWLPKQKLAQ